MAKKEWTGVDVTTPECRLTFPAVFNTATNLNGKEEYSVTMLFEKTADMSKLKAAMVQAAKNEFGEEVDLKTLDMKRIRDGNTKEYAEYQDKFFIKAKTNRQPGVVDGNLNKILDPSEIYSGVYARVALTAKAYTHPAQGVTFYLQHVQKVKDGEPFVGGGKKAEDVFQALEVDEVEVQVTEDDGMFS